MDPRQSLPSLSRPPAIVSAAGTERRDELLRVAIEVFGERGFAGAPIDEIARRVGIRRPSVLYHYPDKSTLYRAAIERVIDEITDIVVTTPGAPGERLEAIADAWIDFVIARPLAARLLLRQMIDAGPVERVNAPVGPLLEAIQAGIDERADPNAEKRVDASEFALILSSTSLVWVASRGAVSEALGLDTLSPDAIQRHRRTLRALVQQLVRATELPVAKDSVETSSRPPVKPENERP